MSKLPSVGLLALSPIADDPRVRRQGDAFRAAGWDVAAFGVAGAVSDPPAWPVDSSVAMLDWSRPIEGASAEVGGSLLHRQWVRRKKQLRYVIETQAPRLSLHAAERAYWKQNPRYSELYRRASRYRPAIWLANDWTVLPIASRLVSEQGGILVYDTHELASEEYAERFLWRALHRPLVVALERAGIGKSSLVTCVSEGIARRLQANYRLSERPLVICNTPFYQPMPFRAAGEHIEVLYHGVVSPGRGLEECIQSVASWRPEFRLTIRGPVSESYKADLERRIAAARVDGRVQLAPPVPMTDLVLEANAADVGLFALPDHSKHNRFVLPNKFFEYTMAGLALCVSDLPEMALLLKRHDLGRLIPTLSPEAIATQVNALDRDMIDRYKRNALAAARRLNWERESEKLLSRCAALLAGS